MATTFENAQQLDLSSIKLKKTKALGRTTSLPAFLLVKPFERAHSTDGIHNQAQSPMARSQPSIGKPSRYKEDFVEQGKLGTGGFGTVCKAQNKLDGSVYAMKKISFRSKNSSALDKVLREVKALAKLDHPNVVRYYQSWIEEEAVDPLSHFKSHNTLRDRKCASDDGTYKTATSIQTFDDEEEESFETEERKSTNPEDVEAEFNSPPGEQIWNFHMRDMFSKIGPSKASEDDLSVEFEREESEESDEESSDSTSFQDETTFDMDMPETQTLDYPASGPDWLTLRKTIQKSFRTHKSIILYIQMQLCEDTLQGWIESRTSVDRAACLSIFRQICKGLEYIHGEGIIHRDLKPSNIFLLSKDQIRESDRKEIQSPRSANEAKWVVIGDFGLAVYRQGQDPSAGTISLSSSVELSQSSSMEHTSGVGTMVYASPEQIHEQSYDEKTDIYSLGIIFFELLCFMSTKMERAHLLGNLRKNILPPDFLKNYPKESAFILWLMAPSPEDRPTAAQVLKHEIFRSESLSISRTTYDRMQDRLKQQDQIIEQQRRQIEELQQKLAMLQK